MKYKSGDFVKYLGRIFLVDKALPKYASGIDFYRFLTLNGEFGGIKPAFIVDKEPELNQEEKARLV